MSVHNIKLSGRRDVAEGTTEFTFEKPEGFVFKAGQNADYTLLDPKETDPEGNKRTFSFVNPPSDNTIVWTTRMRDTAFKRGVKSLTLGGVIQVEGPFGDMTLHNNADRAAVFLAGGIGITPFHSMIADAQLHQPSRNIFLFYSNRRPEDAAYLTELTSFTKSGTNFRFIPTMTDMTKSAKVWEGEKGYINKEMLEKYLETLAGPIYYIAGPPGLVSAMRKTLNDAGVNDDDIRTEEFAGY